MTILITPNEATKCTVFTLFENLSRGVLPENLRRGPYAVVDERCDETTLLLRTPDLQQQRFAYFLGPLYFRFRTYSNDLPTFLDCSILDLLQQQFAYFFFDPSSPEYLQQQFAYFFGP